MERFASFQRSKFSLYLLELWFLYTKVLIPKGHNFTFSIWFLHLFQLTFKSSIMKKGIENKYVPY